MGDHDSSRPRWVHFRISDVFVPDPSEVLQQLHGNDVLQGQVIDTTESGANDRLFAIVSVEGITEPVFVAVDRILGST